MWRCSEPRWDRHTERAFQLFLISIDLLMLGKLQGRFAMVVLRIEGNTAFGQKTGDVTCPSGGSDMQRILIPARFGLRFHRIGEFISRVVAHLQIRSMGNHRLYHRQIIRHDRHRERRMPILSYDVRVGAG